MKRRDDRDVPGTALIGGAACLSEGLGWIVCFGDGQGDPLGRDLGPKDIPELARMVPAKMEVPGR